MLRHSIQKSDLLLPFVILIFVHCSGFAFANVQRKYPCDPKFGYKGNYLEISTGDIASARDVQICFGRESDSAIHRENKWWEFWKAKFDDLSINREEQKEVCLQTSQLPGRVRNTDAKWTDWQKRLPLDKKNTTYQFALCGSDDDQSVWEGFHRHNGVDSWDDMRIVSNGRGDVFVDKLRVVQNRVRILDNESDDEGRVQFLLQGNSGGNDSICLAERIRRTKLNRINCLNLHPGPPYCEQGIPGLENREDIPAVITTALLELGHSGSKKYHRENNAYCSEFSFYVIEKSVQLSDTCKKMIPSPAREDVNVKDMFRWFKMCKRLIRREEIKERIRPGDFISVDNLLHSAIFLGWADPEKKTFWEISGNNRCNPERETFYAPKNKANMVCISLRDFDAHVLERDFGGIVE